MEPHDDAGAVPPIAAASSHSAYPPLIAAADCGDADTVATLIAANADVNARGSNGVTALLAACAGNHVVVASMLLAADAGANPDQDFRGLTPLYFACEGGHVRVASALLAAGAEVNQPDSDGETPLYIACMNGHINTIPTLLANGAAVDQGSDGVDTPLFAACHHGHAACARLLSSYGANRVVPFVTAEAVATRRGHTDLAAWLRASRHWSTPLHHLAVIGADRARTLLRAGADIHAAAVPGGPTPLSLARAMRAAGDAPDGSAAHLVLRAARPWSPQTHSLFPVAAREQAELLIVLGKLLSRQPRFETVEVALYDHVWIPSVVPLAVARNTA